MIDPQIATEELQHSHTATRRSHQSSDINVDSAERWVSTVGGSALTVYGMKNRSLVWTLVGGILVYRGLSGHCYVYEALNINTMGNGQSRSEQRAIEIETAITINREPEELYQYWRTFENLPHFMKHIDDVTIQDDTHSHWRIKMPAETRLEWDAEITQDRKNEMIAWQSLPNADVDNHGSVRFIPAPGGRGTRVHVDMSYKPPAGAVGHTLAKLFNVVTAQQVKEDLRRFKSLMETGEIPTITGQPSGRTTPPFNQRLSKRARSSTSIDIVQEASEDSFPASDPPALTGIT